MVKRLFLTPPDLPVTSASRCLIVPDSKEWWGIFNRALLLTTEAFNYEQVNDTDLTAEDVANACYAIYETYLQGDCGMDCNALRACLYGTDSQYRVDPTTGNLERSDDGGATWETDTEHDPRFISPRLGMSAANCETATFIVGEIQQMVDQIKDIITAGSGIAGLVGVLTSVIAAILSAGIAMPLVVALGGATLGFSTAAIDAALTAAVWERLMCNIYCVLNGMTEVSSTSWEQIKAGIVDDETGIAETMLWNVVNFLGPVGLQNAIALSIAGASLPADCDDCVCVDCEDYVDGFDAGFGPRTTLNTTFAPLIWNWGGQWINNSGRTSPGCVVSTTSGGKRNISLLVDLGQMCTIAEVGQWVVKSTGAASNGRQAIYDDSLALVAQSPIYAGNPVAWTLQNWFPGGAVGRYVQFDFATDSAVALMDDIYVDVTP